MLATYEAPDEEGETTSKVQRKGGGDDMVGIGHLQPVVEGIVLHVCDVVAHSHLQHSGEIDSQNMSRMHGKNMLNNGSQ